MSLRYGLLGLLSEGPASGYDLARRFEQMLGSVWPTQPPKIYGELNRLADEGLIEIESEGPRRRKAYRINDKGLEAVREWLTSGEVDHTLRIQSLLRSAFFWLMEPAELRRHLDEEAAFFAREAARYRAYAEAKDRGEFGDGPQTRSLRIAAEAGVRLHQALADWAEWAKNSPLTAKDDENT
ncbi:PadR family transcriptional regulator [Nonomuraea jabiensis]|uniref:DNA-binding PadR family transcriptional regulator n=1 Tax=Nonomuraea jabiensis TaxID=882448 RepID=A0A7W9LBM7_9ACTN|nr:PadR family transcriptional regulator [Nonomuraea jabiensis]MBB5777821.1 DNA-binding PadR family transcriptional regulator [Nonomuraea jabiensis]